MVRSNRLQYFDLFISRELSGVANRSFHRRYHHQLEQMILEHVAQDTRLVVIPTSTPNLDFFGYGDLDVIDVIAIPNRLEDRISETQHQDVLDGFFAQIMVDW